MKINNGLKEKEELANNIVELLETKQLIKTGYFDSPDFEELETIPHATEIILYLKEQNLDARGMIKVINTIEYVTPYLSETRQMK